jgi:hypothetical protein
VTDFFAQSIEQFSCIGPFSVLEADDALFIILGAILVEQVVDFMNNFDQGVLLARSVSF